MITICFQSYVRIELVHLEVLILVVGTSHDILLIKMGRTIGGDWLWNLIWHCALLIKELLDFETGSVSCRNAICITTE